MPKKVTIKNVDDSVELSIIPNVTSLVIVYPDKVDGAWIDKHFPRVERLTVNVIDTFAIKERLPHVKHFELTDLTCGHFDLKTFAEFNPHIGSVRLELCEGLVNLQQVNDIWPDLVSLHYTPKRCNDVRGPRVQDESQDSVRSIRFRNVTSYTLDLADRCYVPSDSHLDATAFAELSAIQFDRLEALTYLTAGHLGTNDELDFVGQYKEVTNLDYRSLKLTPVHVWRLLAALPLLKEIAFQPDSRFTNRNNEFLRLMTASRLETIHALVDDSLAAKYRAFTLPEQWTLQSDRSDPVFYRSLTFKRN